MYRFLYGQYVFICLGYVPRNGVPRSWDNFIFHHLRSCQTVCQSGCTILHSQEQCMRISISLQTQQHLLSDFFIGSILVDVNLYLILLLICICLMIMMLNIFLCAYWPVVCYPWRNVYSDPGLVFIWTISLFY